MRYSVTTLQIDSGQTLSSVVDLDQFNAFQSHQVLILSPAALPETVTLQVSLDGATYVDLQSGGTDVTLPVGKGTQINNFIARYMRLSAGGAVAANRTFSLSISAD